MSSRCPLCGGLREGPPTLKGGKRGKKLPERTQAVLNPIIQGMQLTNDEVLEIERRLTVEDETGKPKFSHHVISQAAQKWKERNYGANGKGWKYFLGIVEGTAREAAAQSRRIGGVPPKAA